MAEKIKIAIAGIGNCASSLIQGIYYYQNNDNQLNLLYSKIGGYTLNDIKIVAAFDIDERKVGKDISEAILEKPNNTKFFCMVPKLGVIVQRGPTLDGLSKHMLNYPKDIRFSESSQKPVDVRKILSETKPDILINYLPVGSEDATKFYVDCCLKTGVSFINAIPVFIASEKDYILQQKEHPKLLKIVGLNLWRFNGDWLKRKFAILGFLKKEQPAIIFLQEAFDDERQIERNQALSLQNELDFTHWIYDPVEKLSREQGILLKVNVFDGLACISNLPIVHHSLIRLHQEKNDKHQRAIQRIIISFNGKELLFYHVHFSNRDDWAKLHLQETLQYALKEKIQPIIVGDFNIRLINDVVDLSKDYYCSYIHKDYISYPSKNETLDYMLLPKMFDFKEISCKQNNLSDHRPLVITFKILNND